MQKTAQAWFTGGPSGAGGGDSYQSQKPSVLADWNAYAATADTSSDSVLGFDIESAVRTANDKVSGTFDVVSKGVRELPGSLHSATSNVTSGTSLTYFGVLLATGVLFIFIAFTMFLPVMVLVPQKFAICFTIGSAFVVASFFPLKGVKYQLDHMLSKQRLPFTVGFFGSMVGTVYVSMVVHSYILSVLFSVMQVLALAYYVVSYFPGGSTGLKFISSALTSSVMKCFGK
ncbi:hypothetical protein MLD38_033102 [Melastoma candidum]|uniref:Uncharacterized protein n=1 Tax=Melastoma candidum TaxID=119954 RepID=A0ACB9M5F9_9MYRT|nr:hypothetical protein MLD38_033102 [Melastoma candidum]